MIKEKLNQPIFRKIGNVADQMQQEAYVIGGFVRDILLKRPTNDIDIMTVGNGIELAEKVALVLGPKTKVTVFKNFGTAMLRYRNIEIEFVGARKESYRNDSRKPVVESGTLEEDQKRRDFTINAMAISLNQATFGRLSDPFDGISDLKHKIIRQSGNFWPVIRSV